VRLTDTVTTLADLRKFIALCDRESFPNGAVITARVGLLNKHLKELSVSSTSTAVVTQNAPSELTMG
jgi:hypothetical protein